MRRHYWFYFAVVALCGSAAAQEVSTGFSPEIEVDPAHASSAALAQPEVDPDQSSVERLVVRGKERGSEGDDVAEETVPTATEFEAVKTVDLLFYGSG